MLGYMSAKRAVELGRAAFFGDAETDLPRGRSVVLRTDDLTPQFGFVGSRYPQTLVLLIGINPGNGPRNDIRTEGDAQMMPAIIAFAKEPTEERFARACEAYKSECHHWPIWKRHCSEVMGAGKLSFDEIAYSNCLPWRTESGSSFDDAVAKKAAILYARPLIEELHPRMIVAIGKRAAAILMMSGPALPNVITWNCARAATESVKQERASAAAQIFSALGRRRE